MFLFPVFSINILYWRQYICGNAGANTDTWLLTHLQFYIGVLCEWWQYVSNTEESWRWEVSLWEVPCTLSISFPHHQVLLSHVSPFPGSHTISSICNLSDCLIAFSFLFFNHWMVFYYVLYYRLLIHSPLIEGCLSCFQVWTSLNKASVNICI